MLSPDPRGTGRAQPDGPRQRSVGSSPAPAQLRARASSVSAPGGAYHSEPVREGEVEGAGGCTTHHRGGGQGCTKPRVKGGANLGRKAATHTPILVGVGGRRGTLGQPSAKRATGRTQRNTFCLGCTKRF